MLHLHLSLLLHQDTNSGRRVRACTHRANYAPPVMTIIVAIIIIIGHTAGLPGAPLSHSSLIL